MDFGLYNLTSLVQSVARVNTVITDLGLFSDPVYGRTTTFGVLREKNPVAVAKALPRTGERNKLGLQGQKLKNFNIPFFPLDRLIQAGDIQNLVQWATLPSTQIPATLAASVNRVTNILYRSYLELRELAYINAIMGQSFNGIGETPEYDYFTEWGVTPTTVTVDFTDVTSDPADVINGEPRSHIIAEADVGFGSYRIVVLCSSKFFNAVIAHPMVREAYLFQPAMNNPNLNRVGGDNINRVFDYKNIKFIEDTSNTVADGDAWVFPNGIPGMFQIGYAPANTVELANTIAEEFYIFLNNANHRMVTVESETSFIAVNTRPELSVQATGVYPTP